MASGKSVYCSCSADTYRENSLASDYKLWLQTLYTIKHTEQRQPRSMAEGLGAGGVEECKGFSPPKVSTTNTASPRVLLGSLVSNTPTATPSRRTLTEDVGSAGVITSTETVKRMNDLQ